MDYEGVVILGSPRSGTTLLRRLLGAHPALNCPPETNVLRGCGRLLLEERMAQGVTVSIVDAVSFAGMTEEEVLDRVRAFAFGIFRTLRDRSGKPIWVEKSALDAFHVDTVERLCAGSCRFIALFRHPLDTVCSMQEYSDGMNLYVEELHRYVRVHPSPLMALAHAWADTNQRLWRFVRERPSDTISVRYEDLVERPADTVAQIIRFLGLTGDPDGLINTALNSAESAGFGDSKTYSFKEVSKGSVGRWRRLPPDLMRRMVDVVAVVARDVGYKELPTPPEMPIEQARHRLARTWQIVANTSRPIT